MQHARYQRLKLIMIFVIFALPMVTAWGMVQWGIGIPAAYTAHGNVKVDVPSLSEWPLVAPPENDQQTWTLAFDCSSDCLLRRDELWRLHRALGRDAPRLQRLRVGGTEEALPGETISEWQHQPVWHEAQAIWLMDPVGRPALAFSEHADAADILQDIRHLFKVNPQ
ncbi:hypothetical protein [Vreelandella zhaodongensis]|uniref:Transmembrane protein n=1 Tax=Vreelandella zhaodongensis TaxID=1176240 RepID=A0ABX2SPH9_VREZH|nr:hypothetical protein [Halomonas zhaodongensis]NYS43997.1 hypothetical protein [Halomonas zhaodongensis]